MHIVNPVCIKISFQRKSGLLTVHKKQELYELEMPRYQLASVPVTSKMEQAIGFRPVEAWLSRDLICVLEEEQQVINAMPDGEKVKKLDGLLLHLTAKGKKYNCVSRSFAPKLNVAEDPVCGSGHCHIVPLWSDKLDKSDICAYQASQRGGILYCRMEGEKVLMAGKAALYSINEIFLPVETKEE